MRIGVSDPKQQDPDGHTQQWLRERGRSSDPISLARLRDRQDWPAQRKLDEAVAHLRAIDGRDTRPQRQPDVFADAVAKAMRQQLEPEFVEAPFLLQHRPAYGIGAKCAVAAGVAAVVALVFVVAFPASQQGPAEQNASAAEPASPSIWQSLKSSMFPAPQRKLASALAIHDSSGTVNQPLSLGVNVTSPGPGATVTIQGMPAGATLTFGRRASSGDWRLPAQDISDASVIPPADFVGAMYLTAELRDGNGTALVRSPVRLTWTSAGSGDIVGAGMSASAATAPSLLIAPTPPQPTPPQQQPQQQEQQPIAPPVPPAAARAEPPIREISPGEIAGFIKRAQELLATGDLQAARLLLLRAAEAHDARAAFWLAKTFDPIMSKQLGVADPEPDLARARNWYQKAEEWGAPEARRQLEALASYRR
jgi:hypothetical protein